MLIDHAFSDVFGHLHDRDCDDQVLQNGPQLWCSGRLFNAGVFTGLNFSEEIQINKPFIQFDFIYNNNFVILLVIPLYVQF